MTQHAHEILNKIASELPNNGLDDPRRDARLLLALALGRDDAVLPHEDIAITPSQMTRLSDLIARRNQGEPISRLRGWREFYSLDFEINAATLDPRPDSEVLVDAALSWLKANGGARSRLLDLGTGSGCLLLSCLAHTPNAEGVGVDVQPDAVAMAQRNATSLGLDDRAKFLHSIWDEHIDGDFDVILSNPPYIPTGDLSGLMDEVKNYDPLAALDGGDDGLDAWRQLPAVMKRRLRVGGMVFVEIGQGQEDQVAALFAPYGLALIKTWRDLSGIIRCLQFSPEK